MDKKRSGLMSDSKPTLKVKQPDQEINFIG